MTIHFNKATTNNRPFNPALNMNFHDPGNQPGSRQIKQKIRILSIDGGGMRGIIPATIVWYLEQRLQARAGNPEARISDYFDLLAGTSTGGILVCTYLMPDPRRPGRPKLNARESLSLYLDQGGCGIFSRSFYRKLTSMMGLLDEKYCSQALEKALKRCFGETRLQDFLKPCLVTAYNITSRRAFFFTSLDARQDPAQDFPAWKVARATAAAPSFFSPALLHPAVGPAIPLVDGGVFANNPALCAFTETQKASFSQLKGHGHDHAHPTTAEMMIVSLGTGADRKGYAFDAVRSKGMAGWVKPIIDILMSASTETVDYQLRELFAHQPCGGGGRYYRINPALGKADSTMDNTCPRNRWALHQAALDYIETNRERMEEIVDQLIGNQ
ncbi:MAG: patatin-like phospholipase family protein [Phaeodactylibacter sp.]|nr:patatin-like phospholipase family protein [Phaeodactylibacter sp.]MCB9295981.1 patatin-like phospholipase family protein [Lewinellaceae bacterium]